MLSLSTKPAALSSCRRTSSRSCAHPPSSGLGVSRRCAAAAPPRSSQTQRRHRTAAIPEEQNTGSRPGGPADAISVGSDVPSSDTHPDMDPAESSMYTQREEQEGIVNFAEPGSGATSVSNTSGQTGGRDLSDMLSGSTGGGVSSSSSSQKGRTAQELSDSEDYLTGTRPGGPADALSVGSDVPSSDTHPHMDPAESSTYTRLESEGGHIKTSDKMATTAARSSSDRDQGSNLGQQQQQEVMRSADEGSGFAGSGRDLSDMLKEPGEGGGVESDTRAHPAARTAGTALGSAAGTLLGAVAGPAGAAAGAALGGAAGRRIADALAGTEQQAEVYDAGAEPEQVAEELAGGARDLEYGIGAAAAKAADGAKGLEYNIGAAAAKAADGAKELEYNIGAVAAKAEAKAKDAADNITLPTFPPGNEDDFHSAGGGVRLEDDKNFQAAAERVSDAAESARDAVTNAAQTAADKLQSAAGGAKERLSGAGERAQGAVDSTARTAADYGAPEGSQKLREMTNKGEGFTESGEAAAGPTGQPNTVWSGTLNAEAVVKSDVGRPMSNENIEGLGGAAAAGGYGGSAEGFGSGTDADTVRAGSQGQGYGSAPEMGSGVGSYATRGLGEPESGYSRSSEGGVPEGRLAAGGPDSQAAMAAGPESSGAATSDSTADRVAQVYGVGPEAGAGVKEADTYRAEAENEPQKGA